MNIIFFFFKEYNFINALVEKMGNHKFELEYEDQNINGFLGLDIANTGTSNAKNIKFTTNHYIDRLLVLANPIQDS